MKQMPQIHKHMTPMPHTINKDVPIQIAFNLMKEHRIRHLPVLDAGTLVGVVTDRDLKLATSFEGSQNLKVEEVMTGDPFTARPEAPLDEVVSEMAAHKFGCAVIQQDNGKVVGIFTSVDALRGFKETLGAFYKHASADIVARTLA